MKQTEIRKFLKKKCGAIENAEETIGMSHQRIFAILKQADKGEANLTALNRILNPFKDEARIVIKQMKERK